MLNNWRKTLSILLMLGIILFASFGQALACDCNSTMIGFDNEGINLNDRSCSQAELEEGLCTEVLGYVIQVCPDTNYETEGEWPLIFENRKQYRYRITSKNRCSEESSRDIIKIGEKLSSCAPPIGDPYEYVQQEDKPYVLLDAEDDLGACQSVNDTQQVLVWKRTFDHQPCQNVTHYLYIDTSLDAGINDNEIVAVKIGSEYSGDYSGSSELECQTGNLLGPGCSQDITTTGSFISNFTDGTSVEVIFDPKDRTAPPIVRDANDPNVVFQAFDIYIIETKVGADKPHKHAKKIQSYSGCTFEANPRYYGYGGSGYRR